MNFTLSGARTLVAVVAIAGVTGTAATTASAASTPTKAKHAKRLHKKSKTAKKSARPDLVAGGLTVDTTDGGFAVTASVTNQGKSFAKSSDVVIALSDDTTLDDNDEVLDEYHVSGIAAGVTRSFDDEVDLPDDIDSDTEYLIVCVDGNQEISESNESNNCVAEQVDTSGATGDDGSDDNGSDTSDDGSDTSADTAPIVLTGGSN